VSLIEPPHSKIVTQTAPIESNLTVGV